MKEDASSVSKRDISKQIVPMSSWMAQDQRLQKLVMTRQELRVIWKMTDNIRQAGKKEGEEAALAEAKIHELNQGRGGEGALLNAIGEEAEAIQGGAIHDEIAELEWRNSILHQNILISVYMSIVYYIFYSLLKSKYFIY